MTRIAPADETDNVRKKLGARVRYLRLKTGLSQEELADLCRLDRTYLGGIERGERNPSLININRIAAALRIPIPGLFDDTDDFGIGGSSR